MEDDADSSSIDDGDYFAHNEYFKQQQQKEIDAALSTAFDDVTNLSDITISDDDFDSVSNRSKKGVNRKPKSDYFMTNHLNTSTPTRIKSSSSSSHHNKHQHPSPYQHVKNAPTDCHFSDRNDKVSLNLSDDDGEPFSRQFDSGDYTQDLNKDKISSSLLLQNDKLTKQMCVIKGQCQKINSDYKQLEKKFSRLFDENQENLDVIAGLQAKVNHLESMLEVERQKLKRKTKELKDVLNENNCSELMSRTNETHENVVAIMQQMHNNEVDQLKDQIKQLTLQLQEKEGEHCSKNAPRLNEADRYCTNDKKTEEILKAMDQKMISLKEDWQLKLQEDVDKIVNWINNLEKGTGHRRRNENNIPSVDFLPLRGLTNHLQKHLSLTEREQKLEEHIAQFKNSKQQLEEILQESLMLSTSNLSNSSGKSLNPQELWDELEKFKKESSDLAQKLRKYKRFFLLLQKKYQEDVENLKAQYARAINGNGAKFRSS